MTIVFVTVRHLLVVSINLCFTKACSHSPWCDNVGAISCEIGHQIRAPQNVKNLDQQLENAWQNVSQDNIKKLYHPLTRRIQARITTRCGSPITDLNIQAEIRDGCELSSNASPKDSPRGLVRGRIDSSQHVRLLIPVP
ncbi:hypothetical protein TNCV_4692611 [Trichonephila clavipes]|nr:hypothetical protein TNCV_4692611 [Trichonephila clavipes]